MSQSRSKKMSGRLISSTAMSLIFTSLVFGASFEGLGYLPDGDFSSAEGVSDNGSVVIGSSTTSSGEQAFRWTKNGGMVSLGNLPDGSFQGSRADSVSADGSVIVGYGDGGAGWDSYRGYKWTQNTGMELVGSLNGSARYMAMGVSADGSIVVGDGGSQAFRWSQSSGIQGLGVLPGRTISRAVDVSSDGSVAVGSSSVEYGDDWILQQAFRWTPESGMQGLGYLPGGDVSFAIAVSPDGSTIVGTGSSSSGYPGFYWTESMGMVNMGHLPGMNNTHPMDLTLNGEIIVGGSFSSPMDGEAFIWDVANGMRPLKNVLMSDYGLDLTGWTLQAASGITPDGSTIVGWGINPSGQTEAFRAVIHEPTCVDPPSADLNGDCKVDFQDFAVMAGQWLDCGLEPPSACGQ